MSISDVRPGGYSNGRTAAGYAVCAAAVGAFGMIYERFGHGVWSGFMVFAYLLPLCGGTLVFLLMDRLGRRTGRPAYHLYNSGIAVLTVGSLFRGVLDIYGTTSRLSAVYLYAGLVLLALAFLCGLPERGRGADAGAGGRPR